MMDLELLQFIWFILIGVLITGYAILDGFDLGTGMIQLFTRSNEERRLLINAIGPFWDGNEVWLLTAGGALFAAFPIVYATVFSGFYIAFMLLLVALIFRAIALEFRGKVESIRWRNFWDVAFGFGSLIPALLFGVAFGNILTGIPIDKDMMFASAFPESFIRLLNPFALSVGFLAVLLFTMQGANFLSLKTDGDLQNRMVKWSNGAWIGTVIFYVISTVVTFFAAPFMFETAWGNPLSRIVLILILASIVYIPFANAGRKHLHSFLASSTLIASMIAISGLSLFPKIVPSSINLDYSLTIYNASSTQPTLMTMLIITLIGMPIVIGYSSYIYWLFRGKTVLEEDSY